ncbi:hypothetical protein DPMN_146029 [Dreissena polymorpha]|uniref:Caveolin n=1 Tax=Dreissena polymorpha TaxID=45954 RepID=A0A9D4J1X7_DREPO|nr:hypothetical protein DPMN_146029 [Dreissena polymorpha]
MLIEEGNAPRRTNRVAPQPPPPPEDRDPKNINTHLKLDFYSVLAEPPTSPQSFDIVWECSETCFSCLQGCMYKLTTFFCGPCIAFYWGIQFVPFLFANIWIFTPLKQMFTLICGYWFKYCCYFCARTFVSPCTWACGALFINCGDGKRKVRPETPPLFTRKERPKPASKPAVQEKPREVKAAQVVTVQSDFDDYDKEKARQSVRRQLMMF